jgi:hypothetical protein
MLRGSAQNPRDFFYRREQEASPMNDNILNWNFTNWITVSIMVGFSFAVIGWGQSYWAKKHPTDAA